MVMIISMMISTMIVIKTIPQDPNALCPSGFECKECQCVAPGCQCSPNDPVIDIISSLVYHYISYIMSILLTVQS